MVAIRHTLFQEASEYRPKSNLEISKHIVSSVGIRLPFMAKFHRYAFFVALCAAAGLAFWATGRHPYDFYVLTRWVICLTCVWGLALCIRRPWLSFAPAYALVGIVFNPHLPFHFTRATWFDIDIAAGIVLLVALPYSQFITQRSIIVNPIQNANAPLQIQ